MKLKVYRESDNQMIGDRIEVATSFWRRFLGLMFRKSLEPGQGLLIQPCKQIHMLFMCFPIDALFLNDNNEAVCCYHSLQPWTGFSRFHWNAAKVLELPAGTLAKLNVQQADRFRLDFPDSKL